ncbi:MAG: hypothetical protein ABIU09_05375 [Pyrinomonadaceae bacterium]
MDKKFWIAGVAGFLVSFLLSFVAHGILLHADYALLPNIMRTEADSMNYFPFMLLSHLIKGFAFAWIYRQGISAGAPWLTQGVRFGLAAAFLTAVPLYLVYYAVQPMPGTLVVKQIALDSIIAILMGIVVAFISKTSTANAEI